MVQIQWHRPDASGQTLKGNDMLPTVKTAKSHIIAALTALSVASLSAAPAQAWGDKEQNFLAGVVTALVIDGIIDRAMSVLADRAEPVVAFHHAIGRRGVVTYALPCPAGCLA